MPIAKATVQYTLSDDVDIAGMIWRKGSTVFAIPVAKTQGASTDLFLTPHKQYAKRGSHAPVIRVSTEQLNVDGEVLTIVEESQSVSVEV